MLTIEKDILDILEFEKKYSIEWNLLNQITEPIDKKNPLNTTLIYYDNHPRSKFIGGIIINIVDNNFTIGTFTEDLQIGSLSLSDIKSMLPARLKQMLAEMEKAKKSSCLKDRTELYTKILKPFFLGVRKNNKTVIIDEEFSGNYSDIILTLKNILNEKNKNHSILISNKRPKRKI